MSFPIALQKSLYIALPSILQTAVPASKDMGERGASDKSRLGFVAAKPTTGWRLPLLIDPGSLNHFGIKLP